MRVLLVAGAALWAYEWLRLLPWQIPAYLTPALVAGFCYGGWLLPTRVLDALAAAALVGLAHVAASTRFTPTPIPPSSRRPPRF